MSTDGINEQELADKLGVDVERLRLVLRMPSLDVGDTIDGRWKIARYIDHGASAEVYEAEDLRFPAGDGEPRRVALKVFDELYADARQRRHFEDEAARAVRVNHPAIVRVLDAGRAPSGESWIASELMPGGALQDAERGAIDSQAIDERAERLATLADAAHAIHTAGLIHRDINARNVLIDADGAWRLADFGIALRPDQRPDAERPEGARGFASPQQLSDPEHEPSTRDDVYALGALACWVLTGEYANTAGGVPAPPDGLGALPRDLAAVIRMALARDPERRHASADQLARDLRDAIASRPVRSLHPGPLRRAALLARRRPAAVAAAFLACIAVASTTSVAIARHISAAEAEAQLKWQTTAALLRDVHSRSTRKWAQSDNHARVLWLNYSFGRMFGRFGLEDHYGMTRVFEQRIDIHRRIAETAPEGSTERLTASAALAWWLAESGDPSEPLAITSALRAEWAPRLHADDPLLPVLDAIDTVTRANAALEAGDERAQRAALAELSAALATRRATGDEHQHRRLLWSRIARLTAPDALDEPETHTDARAAIDRLDEPPPTPTDT